MQDYLASFFYEFIDYLYLVDIFSGKKRYLLK